MGGVWSSAGAIPPHLNGRVGEEIVAVDGTLRRRLVRSLHKEMALSRAVQRLRSQGGSQTVRVDVVIGVG